ncbi:TIGR04076 family protein [Candidatus Bathyarchaeota archaeon]|nr:TIGR04076 family protein [Candidatus Bathyarchaeota archaeon]
MPYKVVLTVLETRGERPCSYYKVGDRITFEGAEIVKEESDRLCIYALSALFPYITALTRDTPKEDWINRKETIQCPDDARPVIFKITREPI